MGYFADISTFSTEKVPWLCQNMLQIILCYVARICYITNDIYSLICFKALKRKRIDVRNAIGSIHSAAWHDVHLRSGDHILGGKYYGSESVRLQNFLRGCELRQHFEGREEAVHFTAGHFQVHRKARGRTRYEALSPEFPWCYADRGRHGPLPLY